MGFKETSQRGNRQLMNPYLAAGLVIFVLAQVHGMLDRPGYSLEGASSSDATVLPEPYACLDRLPIWFKKSSPEEFRKAVLDGSEGLTDKVHIQHVYQHMYHRYMREIVLRGCEKGSRKIRVLEIGLGCHPTGGMVNNQPGGSAKGWRHIFPAPIFDLDLHVMEYDENCGKKWAAENGHIATLHYGDQGSKEDLARIVNEAGGGVFDVIIDDGSHLNQHQILAAEVLTEYVAPGGILVIEDIHSACMSWKANMGTHRGAATGGKKDCMTTETGDRTIVAALVDWQKRLAVKKEPFKDIMHIDMTLEAAVLQKYMPQ